jgi:acetate kinase
MMQAVTAAPAPDGIVLALNSGSSSLKFGLYQASGGDVTRLMGGEASRIGTPFAALHAADAHGAVLTDGPAAMSDQQAAMAGIAQCMADAGAPTPTIVGHRVVHGGPTLRHHCLIDAAVLAHLEAATAFAPSHIPTSLLGIQFARHHFPRAVQVACFDTTFHADLPDVARMLPIDYGLGQDGLHRYGFHGLSCESIVRQLAGTLPRRVVIAHLGNGSSITAVRDGKSVDTSMGLTPTGGVMMGSRSGDIDPGVLIYLMRARNWTAEMLEDLVDNRSGLKGISGVDGDMRQLHETAASNPRSRLAIDMFQYSVRKHVAAMMSALEGADLLVFTGGIGQHDAALRHAVCEGLTWAGVRREASATACAVRVVPSEEEEQIARHAWRLTR